MLCIPWPVHSTLVLADDAKGLHYSHVGVVLNNDMIMLSATVSPYYFRCETELVIKYIQGLLFCVMCVTNHS